MHVRIGQLGEGCVYRQAENTCCEEDVVFVVLCCVSGCVGFGFGEPSDMTPVIQYPCVG